MLVTEIFKISPALSMLLIIDLLYCLIKPKMLIGCICYLLGRLSADDLLAKLLGLLMSPYCSINEHPWPFLFN